MRILMWIGGADTIPGGHRVQVEETFNHLQQLGVSVDRSSEERPDLSRYDVMHAFGLSHDQLRAARLAGIPIVLSTVYWGRTYANGQDDRGEPLATLVRRTRVGLSLFRSSIEGRCVEKCEAFTQIQVKARIAFELADLLLPNSDSEAAAVVQELGVTTPMQVVPNAVNPSVFQLPANSGPGDRDHVLYIGRFEPHKNQLGLIDAMKRSKLPLRLVGPPHPHHPAYYKRCNRRLTGRMAIIPPLEHHRDLAPLYSRAKVHVQPSWFETTGLSSLEAALCGCNIVTTNRGYAKDYFGDFAWYCDPADPDSIREAVESAYDAPLRTGLVEHILKRFTWDHTARATLAAYRTVFGRRSTPRECEPQFATVS